MRSGEIAEIALMVVGAGVAITGGMMVGLGDRASTRLMGATLGVLGGGALVGGTIGVAVDGVRRGRESGRQVMVVWRREF